jgi:hypothetical protein
MFFNFLRARRSSKSSPSHPLHDTPPPRTGTSSLSQCASSSIATTGAVRERRSDEEAHDYELFLEKARKQEEEREKARLEEVKEAQRRRAEASMDPWTRRW